MAQELSEKELQEIIGGLEDDGKLFNIQCTANGSATIFADLKGVHGTAGKDKALATLTKRGYKCTVTAVN